MQDSLITKNQNKNIFLGENGVSLILNIDQTTNKTLSLKNFLKKSFLGALSTQNLDIQIILAPDIDRKSVV